mmetsp:Transcript_28490/g.80246  ORF Transcript_28490/g.80246 Transcript_28490/m.80246 type:complete len:80 (+) Transcript_28490:1169-1408(+)
MTVCVWDDFPSPHHAAWTRSGQPGKFGGTPVRDDDNDEAGQQMRSWNTSCGKGLHLVYRIIYFLDDLAKISKIETRVLV